MEFIHNSWYKNTNLEIIYPFNFDTMIPNILDIHYVSLLVFQYSWYSIFLVLNIHMHKLVSHSTLISTHLIHIVGFSRNPVGAAGFFGQTKIRSVRYSKYPYILSPIHGCCIDYITEVNPCLDMPCLPEPWLFHGHGSHPQLLVILL